MKHLALQAAAAVHANAIVTRSLLRGFLARPSVTYMIHMTMLVCAAIVLWAFASEANAAAAVMPWEGPLCAVANSMKSTVAKAAAIIAIVIAGLAMAFGEMSGIFKTLMGLVAGASMALLATSWLSFLGGGTTFC